MIGDGDLVDIRPVQLHRLRRRIAGQLMKFLSGSDGLHVAAALALPYIQRCAPLKDLDKEGKLFDAPKFEHDYPFCWRCDTPLIYYARESWFIKRQIISAAHLCVVLTESRRDMHDARIKMTAVRDDLVRNNKTVNWIPESIGEGRFGNWLENIQDWGISPPSESRTSHGSGPPPRR